MKAPKLAAIMAALTGVHFGQGKPIPRFRRRQRGEIAARQRAWTPILSKGGVWTLPGRAQRAVRSVKGPGWRYHRSIIRNGGVR